MAKVSMTGSFTSQDGKADELEALLVRMVEAARAEPGIEIYSYHRGEENKFWFFALMTDQESMQNHGKIGGGNDRTMTDILIRGVLDEVLAAIDAKAKRVGL